MSDTPDRLAEILRHKVAEVTARAAELPLPALSARVEAASPPRGFANALHRTMEQGSPAVIAEIKRASPSKGILRPNLDPAEIARAYESAGAACLSVLTDEAFFRGSLLDFKLARGSCALPVLRKDFMLDAWQIYESRLIGADCILLIVAALGDAVLQELCVLAMDLGMDVLVEVHDREELDRALATPATLIGINNRNLHTFETDFTTTLDLKPYVPDDRLLISESGITDPTDVELLRDAGVNAFLVGETLMRSADPGEKLKQLFD